MIGAGITSVATPGGNAEIFPAKGFCLIEAIAAGLLLIALIRLAYLPSLGALGLVPATALLGPSLESALSPLRKPLAYLLTYLACPLFDLEGLSVESDFSVPSLLEPYFLGSELLLPASLLELSRLGGGRFAGGGLAAAGGGASAGAPGGGGGVN